MPYIKPEERERLNVILDKLSAEMVGIGEVVYCTTYLVHKYVLDFASPPSYATKSLGKAVLQDALDEYKRMVMDRHEDKKRRENGAVSELDAIQLNEVM